MLLLTALDLVVYKRRDDQLVQFLSKERAQFNILILKNSRKLEISRIFNLERNSRMVQESL